MKIATQTWNCYDQTQIWLFQQIYDFIMGLEEGITCDSTVDAEFNNEDPSHVATLNFTIRDNFILRVKRSAGNDTKTTVVTVWSLIVNNQVKFEINLNTWRSGGYPGDTCGYDNYYRLKAVLTDNFVGIWVQGNWGKDITTPFPTDWRAVRVTDGTTTFVGASNATGTNNIIGCDYFDLEGNGPFNIKVVLPFQAGPGEIYYSELTPLAPATGASNTYNLGDLVSCSTVIAGSSIALANGKNYWAVAPNLMLEVPEE